MTSLVITLADNLDLANLVAKPLDFVVAADLQVLRRLILR